MYEPGRDARGALCVGLPLAEERKGCVRVVHELGVTLAGSGWRTLVFDYAGTGESPGSFRDLTWASLVADAQAALAWLRERAQGPTVVLGIRAGARVMLEAASADTAQAALLWAPVLDPGLWLRDLRRRSRFRGTGAQAPANGGWDVDGYLFSDRLCADLEGLGPRTDALDLPCALVHIGRPSPGSPPGCAADRTVHLATPGFWLETEVVDSAPLVRASEHLLEKLVS